MRQAGWFLLGVIMLTARPASSQPPAPAAQADKAQQQAGTDCRPREVSGQVTLSDGARRVVDLLAAGDAAPGERIPVLEQYLARTGRDAESVDFVLRNYARMALGADYLQIKQFERARERLSGVRLDSPAGVNTALLIARSHQLEGNNSKALKWYVRVGERYPANPQVLESLLGAAAMAEDSNPRLAAGIYERALKKALASIEEMAGLKKEMDPLSDILLAFPKDAGTTVGGQVVREVLHTGVDALPHLRHVLNTREKLTCLEKQLEAVEEQLFQVTERGTRIGAFQTMLGREREAMEERITRLEEQLAQAYRSSEKQKIREELSRVRKRLETMDQRQAELERQRRKKTEGPQQAREALRERERALRDYLAENRQAINRELEVVMEALRKQYMDLAGEGQMGKARMMREIAVRDTR